MNQLPKLTAEQAFEVGMMLVRDFDPGTLWELQVAASHLEKAALRLRAIPNYPDCQDARLSHRLIVSEAIEDLRRLIENV